MKQPKEKTRFVICIRNEGCEDLAVGKVYSVLADASAAKEDHLRIVDESGEDYLYPSDYFVSIALPQAAEKVLLALASSKVAA